MHASFFAKFLFGAQIREANHTPRLPGYRTPLSVPTRPEATCNALGLRISKQNGRPPLPGAIRPARRLAAPRHGKCPSGAAGHAARPGGPALSRDPIALLTPATPTTGAPRPSPNCPRVLHGLSLAKTRLAHPSRQTRGLPGIPPPHGTRSRSHPLTRMALHCVCHFDHYRSE